ncbi:MAG: helix-turn-helix domain-containing protein [Bacillota bacterium]
MDMQKVGAFISERRKSMDFTQAELAGLLTISHQAVSKWERGESLPDVALLPGLAELLNVSIDTLLNGGEARVIASSKPSFSNSGEPAPTESLAISSAPSEEQLIQKQFTINHVKSLAPFLPKETLEEMVGQIDDEISWSDLHALAPFIGRSALEELVDKIGDTAFHANEIIAIAPFLGQDVLRRLLDHVEESSLDWGTVHALAPFVEISQLIERMDLENLTPVQLSGLAPFLPTELLNTLVRSFKAQ